MSLSKTGEQSSVINIRPIDHGPEKMCNVSRFRFSSRQCTLNDKIVVGCHCDWLRHEYCLRYVLPSTELNLDLIHYDRQRTIGPQRGDMEAQATNHKRPEESGTKETMGVHAST
jgi:hypothetical protein